MTHSATIYAHPEMCHNPLDLAALESATDMRAVSCRQGFKFVPNGSAIRPSKLRVIIHKSTGMGWTSTRRTARIYHFPGN